MLDRQRTILFIIGIIVGSLSGGMIFQSYYTINYQKNINELKKNLRENELKINLLEKQIQENEATFVQLELAHDTILKNYSTIKQELEETLKKFDDLTNEFNSLLESIDEVEYTKISIFYLNDLHGRLHSFNTVEGSAGGVTRIAHIINEAREESGTHVLFLTAGDILYGTILSNYYEGVATVDALNAMECDAMTLGNHEFDRGYLTLQNALSKADFPVLAANIHEEYTGEYPSYWTSYFVETFDDVEVAILGLTIPYDYDDLSSYDPIVYAGYIIDQVDDQADIIIALTHIGFNNDIELAESVPGIDIIVGGHSHTRIDVPEIVDDTIIVQAWEHGLVLGRLDIEVVNSEISDYDGYLIPITNEVEEDSTVLSVMEPYFLELEPIMFEVVGSSLVDLISENQNHEETNVGNLVTDSMLWKAKDADVAFQNPGGLRWHRVFPAGEITRADVHELLPFQNSLVLLDLTGEQLKEELEFSVCCRWLQVSGIEFTYDSSRPDYQKLVDVRIAGEPIVDDQVYRVAIQSYLAGGGDGHVVFTQGSNYEDAGVLLADCLIEYLQEFSPVYPVVEGRALDVH